MKKLLMMLRIVSIVGSCSAMDARLTDAEVQALVENQEWEAVFDRVEIGRMTSEQLCRYDKAQFDVQDEDEYTLFQALIWLLEHQQSHSREHKVTRISECLKVLICANKVTHNAQLINELSPSRAARCQPLYTNILQSIADEQRRSTPPVISHMRSPALWYLAGGAAVITLAVGVWKYYHSTAEAYDETVDEKTESMPEIAQEVR